MKNLKFDELSLSPEIQNAIVDMGFTEASPIQSQAIPFILEGKDVIGQAQTGTGKTAAFGIPALEMIDTQNKNIQTLVMCPTRELALQVANEIKKLAKYKKGLNVLAVYGGESIERQIKDLKKGIQIVIGTPGRIIDHLNRKTIKFDQVKMVVLDEADEMLNMGFREDIEEILTKMPDERQTILFSATMAKPIMALTKKYQNDPQLVKVTKNELTVSSIEQIYFEVKNSMKMEVMTRLMDMHNFKLMLVFCNTKRMVDEAVEQLQAHGYQADSIHGDLRQNQRNLVMAKFRKGTVNILVATDVAARGIDVDDVDAVFNYDLPMDDEYYVHRIGRTGRAGKSGKAFTFITSREIGRLRELQNYTKVKIDRGVLPSNAELAEFKSNKLLLKIQQIVNLGGLKPFEAMVEGFTVEGLSMTQIAAALLKNEIGVTQESKPREERRSSSRGEESGRSRGEESGRSRGDDFGRRPERGERRERIDGSDRKSEGASKRKRISTEKMVRLFISVGKYDSIRPGDIVGAIAGETGLSGDRIGDIEIFDKFSFVEIPKDSLDQVMAGMDNNQIKGKKVNLEVAKQKS